MMYPVMMNLKDKKCIVIGGGKTALRKAKKLTECGAEVTAVSPAFCEGFEELNIICKIKEYEKNDLIGAFLSIAATDSREVNLKIREDANTLGILVSLADAPKLSDFISPASRSDGGITVAVSTNGAFPLLSKKLCEIKSEDISLYSAILPLLEKYRRKITAENGDTKVLNALISEEMLELAKKDIVLFEKRIEEIL